MAVRGGRTVKRRLVVVGNGMVGQRLLHELADRDASREYDITVIGEERRPAYDRVALSSVFDGKLPEDLALAAKDFFEQNGIALHLDTVVTSIDVDQRRVSTSDGAEIGYDDLVLATGSYPFVPPIPGTDSAGVFVYRTLDDLDAIDIWAAGCSTGVVVGGGLLGLEAANALRNLGLTTHVVEFAPRLMALQLDDGGAAALRSRVEALGITVHLSKSANEVRTIGGQVRGLTLADGSDLSADLVVFAAGVRPRDQLARDAGLVVGERGGVVIDDTCATSAPAVWAVGEVACHRGRVYGLVAPGYAMAEVLAKRLCGADATFTGADVSTKLKLLGIDVASVGQPLNPPEGALDIVLSDPVTSTYKRVVLSGDGGAVHGAILVGDASAYATLLQIARGALPMPDEPASLVASSAAATVASPATNIVCSCNGVSEATIVASINDDSLDTVKAVKTCTRAGTTCGSCVPLIEKLLATAKTDGTGSHLCAHFAHSRAELFDIMRVRQIRSFAELISEHGTGRGCEICKPAVASMLASMSNGYILDGEQATLQDTNDHFLANLQRDGTYSVVPRVPGGEIRADQLITLGEVARDFDLYVKITGGQRIDLFGARVDQLPAIWARLIDAGFESGHAYGKALRTVKSCVGTTWCRYGVQDSVGFAIRLELRYRGLRAPHKLKSAVSGCARECAEAQGKDFGFIATERGYNVYVCGNGGMRPRHATLLAEDLDEETVIRYLDRFLMYYIRTADRLERTATWFERRFGGEVEQLRAIVIDDSLGLAADLEADMAKHVDGYECEWKATLASPERLGRFAHFVNTDAPDPNLVYVRARGQRLPAPSPRPGVPA